MKDDQREAYEPPTLTRVRFAPGEVAAGACKSIPNPPGSTTRCQRTPGPGGVIVSSRIGS